MKIVTVEVKLCSSKRNISDAYETSKHHSSYLVYRQMFLTLICPAAHAQLRFTNTCFVNAHNVIRIFSLSFTLFCKKNPVVISIFITSSLFIVLISPILESHLRSCFLIDVLYQWNPHRKMHRRFEEKLWLYKIWTHTLKLHQNRLSYCKHMMVVCSHISVISTKYLHQCNYKNVKQKAASNALPISILHL